MKNKQCHQSHSKKIVFLITNLDFGGAELQVHDLAICLKKNGHNVTVITFMKPKALKDNLERHGISVYSLNLEQHRKISWLVSVFKLSKLIRSLNPDIVHTHLTPANIIGRLTRLRNRYPLLISTIHSINEGGKLRCLIYNITDFLSDKVTFVSKAAFQKAVEEKRVKGNKGTVIYNFIDLDKFQFKKKYINTTNFRWICVARFVALKGHKILLEAFSKLRSNTSLTLIGDGPEKIFLKNYCETLGIEDRVCFAGTTDNVSNYLNESDGFILASKYEAYGLVLAEAMACGLPTVSTPSGGPNELLKLSDQSYFLSTDHTAEELRKKMEYVMDLSEKQYAIESEKGRTSIINNFSKEIIYKKWEEVYEIA